MRRSPLWFFFIVVLLSMPFWLLGSATTWQPLSGVPTSALMFLAPGLVAFALVAHDDGRAGAMQWLKESLNPSSLRRGGWLLAAISLPPAMMLAVYIGMSFAGYLLPEPEISVASAVMLFVIFLIPAAFEELGWSGFALVAIQQRMTALMASLLIGGVWAAWHFIPLWQAGRSPDWIAWWSLTTVALRILMTWVFNNSAGSVLLATVFHASENASWQSFPNRGSHYDPAIHAVVLWSVSCVIVTLYGGKTLVRLTSTPRSGKPCA